MRREHHAATCQVTKALRGASITRPHTRCGRKRYAARCYAAEVLLLVEEEPEDDDFASEDDEDEDAVVEDFASEEDDEDFDVAGLLLDDEPRLSFR